MKSNHRHYDNWGMHRGAPPISFAKARNLRQNMTVAEKKLWVYLKNKNFLGFKFRRQHPIHIYIVDFYCHELKLIIEIDGEYHNTETQLQKDSERSDILEFQGLNIIRFSNSEIHNSIDNVLKKIENFINKNNSLI